MKLRKTGLRTMAMIVSVLFMCLVAQAQTPTITQISPTTIAPAGGNVITITGTNFVTGATVTFGSNSGTNVAFVSATTLKATAPASTNKAEGPVNVTVTDPDNQSATLPNGLLYQKAAPTITKISPTAASTSGGTVITITGTGFGTGSTVAFGPNNATNVVFVSSTSLKATAPASTLATGEGHVSVFVTNPDTLSATLSEGLTYDDPPMITSISPVQGTPAGGFQVAITGANFRCGSLCPGGPKVLFGATPATSVLFNSGTSLTVTAPAGAAGVVNIKETNTDGLSTTLTNGFTYSAVAIGGVSPTYGPLGGGNTVTITGGGFTNTSTVMFGTTAATSVTYISSTTLTAVAPKGASGHVKITVTNSNGTGVLPQAYDYLSGPVIYTVSPAAGPLAGGTTITLKGYQLKGVTNVTFGGAPAAIVSGSATFNQIQVTNPAYPVGATNPVTLVATDPGGSSTLAGAFNYQLSIVTLGLDDGYPTFPYSNTLNVQGGMAPYTWSITSGALPSGLSLNASTGVISGTPAANYGQYTIGLKVKDSATPANVATTSLTFNILFGFSTEVIPPQYFGMILYNQNIWPTVPVGALGKGLGVTWPFIEQVQGTYNWNVLDQYVADAQAHQVPGTSTPLSIYWTNANVPPWAASDPSTCTAYTGTNIYACTSAVSNIQYFNDFMTALVTRYLGKIQIYELWSEPNISNVYTGTVNDLATMTASAYNIIRTLNPSATILSPSPTAAPYLLSYFEAPGAPLGFDAVAIHGYPNVGVNDVAEAIVGFKSVPIKLAMVQAPGVGIKPIWDSETSWGGQNAITDPDLRVGFVARSLLLHWSVGIHTMYWYGWDAPVWGTLYYPPPGIGATPAATAWTQTYDWMLGASMPSPCSANGGSTYVAVYTCQLVRSGGYQALAVWDTTQTCNAGVCTHSNYTPGTQYVQYRDLTGAVYPISAGQTIQIGTKPILLENMNPPAGTLAATPSAREDASAKQGSTPLGLAMGPPSANVAFNYAGLTPNFASTAAANPSFPEVPASPNLAPTAPPVPDQVPLENLVVMPGLAAPIAGNQAVDSDATLAVGKTQVMQWADFRLQVFGKNVAGAGLNPVGNALQGNLFWSSNSACSVAVGADGTVQFDKLASVWLVGMRTGGNQECIAVSQTASATQKYYQYTVEYVDAQNPTFQMDYPKIGVWPDAYYLTFDMLDPANNFAPRYAVVCALERSAMLVGSANAEAICLTSAYSNNTGFFHLLPSDMDGVTPPPAGSPNHLFTFAKPVGSTEWHLYEYRFHVDFTTPSVSTLTGPIQIDANAYGALKPACIDGSYNCVPQPPPAVTPIDSVGGYLMGRAAYRNFGNYESLVLSQAVQTVVNTPIGIRWYELRNLKTTTTIHQKGFLEAADSSTTPDTFSRWMSAASEDKAGNLAMGYSISGKAATSYYSGFPGIAVNGRISSTPLNELLTENIVFPGVSVVLPPAPKRAGRWGAVAGISIDPSDQCTFYFTGQYQPTAGINNWATQIVSFKLPACQ